MKVCLVTTFPPSRGGLSEYGFHIARELQRNPFLSVTVLADEVTGSEPELGEFSVNRCWSFNDPKSSRRLLRTIRQLDPDVVWFNLLFTTFGHNPLVAFFGLSTPALARLYGHYSHVTLHHLMDTVDLSDAGVRFPRLYRAGGSVATKMLLLSNSVTVLMPTYRKVLMEQYGQRNVHLRAHGILSSRPEYPDFSLRGNPVQRVLAFGKWGTYKRLEPMIEAFFLVTKTVPNIKLVIAGGNHPRTPGYVESVARNYENDHRLDFTGYVPEEAIPDLFRTASVAVMPYSSSTGSSGIAHLACAYGVPIVSVDLPDFRQMAEEEGMAIEFYSRGDTRDLADHMISLLRSPEQQRAMAEQNFSAALRMTMPRIIQEYVRRFGVEQRNKAFRSMMRFRRLPRWVSSRLVATRWTGLRWTGLDWSERPFSAHLPRGSNGNSGGLENVDSGGSGSFGRPSIPVDHDGVAADGNPQSLNGRPGSSTGVKENGDAQQGPNGEDPQYVLPADTAGQHDSHQTESEQAREQGDLLRLRTGPPAAGGNGHGGNGKNGGHGIGAGSDHGWIEGATHTGGQSGAREPDSLIERPRLRDDGDAGTS